MRGSRPQVIRYTISCMYGKYVTSLVNSHRKIDFIIILLNALR